MIILLRPNRGILWLAKMRVIDPKFLGSFFKTGTFYLFIFIYGFEEFNSEMGIYMIVELGVLGLSSWDFSIMIYSK
jgi:hypothetical protein